ncbi:MAG: hypothetical protein J6X66_04995 [Lachnospiraceae bacterium]|nr:hypothetical protein [Lachnospiraceae bacterium]
MTGIHQCVGRYASEPLIIKNTYIRVWCLEELCYYICENADLLDDSFESNELIDWIGDECGLKDLASRLRIVRRQSVKLESFVAELLNAADYVDEEELKRISRVIRANRSMPETGRLMVLADYFLRGGNFIPALKTYERLLLMEQDGPDQHQLSRIYINLGVIFAKLFCYSEAADFYMKAIETENSEEAMFGHLAAKRMQLSDGEYLEYLSSLKMDTSVSAKVEDALQQAKNDFKGSQRGGITDGLRKLRMGSDRSEYLRDATGFLQYEKDRYRKYMSE